MEETFSPRWVGFGLASLALVMAIGTVRFRWALDETWLQDELFRPAEAIGAA